jgi:hypothetical protein
LCATVQADAYAVDGSKHLDQMEAPTSVKRLHQESAAGKTAPISGSEPLPAAKVKLTPTLDFFFKKLSDSNTATNPNVSKFLASVQCPREVYRALGCTRQADGSRVPKELTETHFEKSISELDERRVRTLVQSAMVPVVNGSS